MFLAMLTALVGLSTHVMAPGGAPLRALSSRPCVAARAAAVAMTDTTPPEAPRLGGTSRERARIRHRVRGLFHSAQTARRANNIRRARSLLEECLELDPYDAHSWLALARLEQSAGHLSLARSLYSQGHAACPGNPRLIHSHAMLEARAGDADAARELFARVAECDVDNAYAYHAWGQVGFPPPPPS